MKYNCCDDMGNPPTVNKYHENMVRDIGLPQWMHDISCPFCNEKLGIASLRAVTFKTNARNIGDLCIDFLCKNCQQGDYFYFRSIFKNTNDINDVISGKITPKDMPILEEKMYAMQYNNVIEKMLSENK